MKIADMYDNGECPDCGEDIPHDMVDGGECANCGHVFHENNESDDCDEEQSGEELLEEARDQYKLYSNEGRTGVENLCRVVHMLGYKDRQYMGQFHHAGSLGDLIEFLEDNSGAIEAIYEFIATNIDKTDWAGELETYLNEKE